MSRTLRALVLLLLWPSFALAQQAASPSSEAPPTPSLDHDHSGHGAAAVAPATSLEENQAHHPAPESHTPLPAFIPVPTDADREAAFPDVHGHTIHDNAVNYFVLFDRLERLAGGGTAGVDWDTKGWVGRDRDRIWFRSEGARTDAVEQLDAQVLYGRAVARWWDVVAGVRHDVRPGPARTWAAIGLQGLAPYWFEIEATAYVGASGRTFFRFETEYELLVTNRLILQPLVEFEIHGKSDPDRGIGAGLSSTEAGVRLRYEFRREFAPYVGVTWERKHFGTAARAAAAGDSTGRARLAVGLRLWL